MADPAKELRRLLEEHGAVLQSKTGHMKWRLPDGQSFVHSKTASDRRSDKNAVHELKRILGLTKTTTSQPRIRIRRNKSKEASVGHFDLIREAPPVQDFQHKLGGALKAVYTPPEPTPKRKYQRTLTPSNKPSAFSPTPEILKEADRILNAEGAKAMADYLNRQRSNFQQVANTRHTKERTVETPIVPSVDTQIRAAKRLKMDLEQQVATCDQRIIDLNAQIEATNKEKCEAEHKLVKVRGYLEAHELLLNEGKEIESLFPANVKLAMYAQGQDKTPRATTTTQFRDVMGAVRDVFFQNPSTDFKAGTIAEQVNSLDRFKTKPISNLDVHSRLNQLMDKDIIARVGAGTYRLKSSTAQLAATA
jgi:hypothetical protein